MRKTARLALLITAAAVILPGCTARGEEEAFKKAQEHLIEGNYEKAITGCAAFIERFPQGRLAPQCQYMIGYVYSRHLSNPRKAMDAYSLLFYLYPDSPQVYLAREDRAKIYSSMDDHVKAIGEYAWLVENGPYKTKDLYRYKIALEYIKADDFRQARIELAGLLKEMPQTPLSPDIHYHIAITHYLEGNLKEAIEAYENIISSFPGHPVYMEARLGKAQAIEESGRLGEAFKILLGLEKEYPNADVVRVRMKSLRERRKKELS